MRIRNKQVKRTPLLALMVCVMLVGTVAAIAYSNSLTGSMNLVTLHQMEISWVDDIEPFTESGILGQEYSATLNLTNLAGGAQSGILIRVALTTPSGCDATMWTLFIGVYEATFTGSDTTFEGISGEANNFAGFQSRSYLFTWTFESNAILGSYDFEISAWIL